jgi:hypothetical protein
MDFELTADEFEYLRSQFGTSNKEILTGIEMRENSFPNKMISLFRNEVLNATGISTFHTESSNDTGS